MKFASKYKLDLLTVDAAGGVRNESMEDDE